MCLEGNKLQVAVSVLCKFSPQHNGPSTMGQSSRADFIAVIHASKVLCKVIVTCTAVYLSLFSNIHRLEHKAQTLQVG